MEIRKIPVKQINPATYNPRKDLKPGDDEYERLKLSIDEFGLVELAFISNPEEEKLLKDSTFQQKCALGIANGILRTVGREPIKEVNSMFKDVPANHWAYKDIEKLEKLGIVKGDDKGNFNPDKAVTRAEVAAMLSRLYDAIKNGK